MATRHDYRHDLTGLRAVAVLLVVLFHAKVPGFDAGFVGVDVFFALSGFLITRGLVEQVEAHGRIDLIAFWAARFRRLIPAATAVIVATVVASMIILSPLIWRDRLTEAWAATFYFANYHFGNATQNYFAAGDAESPLLHFWSLSVEEQWYLALPIAMSAVGFFARGDTRRNIIRLLVMLIACSFVVSAASLTVPRTSMTYFSSLSRVWELGAGGLLALTGLPSVMGRVSAPVRRLAGFALIGLALVVVDPAAVYPGVVALLPIVGTLLIIDAVGGSAGPLESRLAIWTGEHSYSWYLWHWPVIVLGEAALLRWSNVAPSPAIAVALAVASLLPAAACRRFIEEPFRTSSRLRASTTATFASVGVAVGMSFVVLFGSAHISDGRFAEPEMLAFVEASEDRPPITPECATPNVAKLLAECTVGTLGPQSSRILLVGDSHMANWHPAFEEAAERAGHQTIAAIAPSCSLIGDGTDFDQLWWCTELRNGIMNTIGELQPDIVVIGQRTNGYLGRLLDAEGEPLPRDTHLDAWIAALTKFVTDVRSLGSEVVVVQPTPTLAEDPLRCGSLSPDLDDCIGSRADLQASIAEVSEAQRAAVGGIDGVRIFDPVEVVCGDEVCLFEDGGHYVWTDTHHVTSAFSKSKAAEVARFVE